MNNKPYRTRAVCCLRVCNPCNFQFESTHLHACCTACILCSSCCSASCFLSCCHYVQVYERNEFLSEQHSNKYCYTCWNWCEVNRFSQIQCPLDNACYRWCLPRMNMCTCGFLGCAEDNKHGQMVPFLSPCGGTWSSLKEISYNQRIDEKFNELSQDSTSMCSCQKRIRLTKESIWCCDDVHLCTHHEKENVYCHCMPCIHGCMSTTMACCICCGFCGLWDLKLEYSSSYVPIQNELHVPELMEMVDSYLEEKTALRSSRTVLCCCCNRIMTCSFDNTVPREFSRLLNCLTNVTFGMVTSFERENGYPQNVLVNDTCFVNEALHHWEER